MAQMNIVRGRTYTDQEVILDYSNFMDCQFEGCVLTYHGSGPTDLETSTVEDCRFKFSGPAFHVVRFFAAMYEGGRKIPVLNFVRDITRGDIDFALGDIEGEQQLIATLGKVEEASVEGQSEVEKPASATTFKKSEEPPDTSSED